MVLLASHDSACNKPLHSIAAPVWPWARTQKSSMKKQFELGARYFDLRYSYNETSDQWVISHTIATSYTVENAMKELLGCALDAKEKIIIRFKRDSAHPSKKGMMDVLKNVSYKKVLLSDCVIKNKYREVDDLGQATEGWLQYVNAPIETCILMFSDNGSYVEDEVDIDWMFPQLFDTIETWQYNRLQPCITKVKRLGFSNNGLPKAVYIDWSSYLPPLAAHSLLWRHVDDFIKENIKNKVIQCVMVNSITPELANEILTCTKA